MTILECSCKDATKQTVRSKIVSEYENDKATSALEKRQELWGDCSCTIDGKKHRFQGISLDITSRDPAFLDSEAWETALDKPRVSLPAFAIAAPRWNRWFLL